MNKYLLNLAYYLIFLTSLVQTQSTTSPVNNATQPITTTTIIVASSTPTVAIQKPLLRIKTALQSNYTRKAGERLRLECQFEYLTDDEATLFNSNDFTLYWVKNYQELLQTKKGFVHVLRKNMSTILVLKNLESFDSGSYMCVAEFASSENQQLNASSETTLFINDGVGQQQQATTMRHRPAQPKFNPQSSQSEFSDDFLADLTNDNSDDLNDEFPSLNPTIVENFDDKGFCEPYKGTICAGIITNNYSVYSTSTQQQEQIEERLKTIIPLLMSNKNNLSNRCSTFAIPSLCMFAFPLCDKQTKQPKQICRSDCKQLQQDLCKNEYFNVKTLFESKLSDNLQHQASNFLLDCNQLPPSSDSPQDCLPIVSMTLDKLESQVISLNNANNRNFNQLPASKIDINNNNNRNYDDIVTTLTDKKIMNLLYILIPSVCIPFMLICLLLTFCYCRRNSTQMQQNAKLNPNGNNVMPLINNSSSNCANSIGSNSNSNLHPSRLRMSNASIKGSKGSKHLTHNRAGSSKSSVASSQNTQDQQQFLAGKGNYDNHFLYNSNFPPPPMAQNMIMQQQLHQQQQQQQQPVHNIMNQQMFQQQLQLQHQQPQLYQMQMQSDYTVKQFSPNSIRLLQEVGKGRFGQVYVGELIGTFAPTSVVKTVVKTLNLKQFNNPSQPNRVFNHDQITSTPNINNMNHNNNNLDQIPTLPNQSAAAHFQEQEFYNEISLYSSLKNRHLANLIGVYTTNSTLNKDLKLQDNENDLDVDDSVSMLTDTTFQPSLLPQCMIFEHLNNGDLHEYLMQRASTHHHHPIGNAVYNGCAMMAGSQSNLSAASSSIGGVSSNYLNIQQQQRNIADFLYIGQQIASGMEYLASQNFVLKDLATRNILMSDNLTIKISIDLVAQYKDAYAKDYYKFQNKPLPVRWMSPESLLYGRYTQQSDVWSFGVTLWEIFNYGCQPYSGCTNPEAIEMIRDRQLLLIPDECPQRAYSLMLECWHEIPMQRPTFTEILNKLRNWENYYLFNNQTVPLSSTSNNNNNNNIQQTYQGISQMPLPPAPLPLPLHLQQQQQQQQNTHAQFQMTTSYSSNSQNSKASSLLGNTASTGISASSCSPLPPPPSSLPPSLQLNNVNPLMTNVYYSPSKNMNSQYQVQAATTSTNLFAAKFQKTSPPQSTIVTSNTLMSNNNSSSSTRIYRDLDPTSSLRASQRYNNNNPIQSTFSQMPPQMDAQYDIC